VSALMCLSISNPTYPRLGSGWGFVGDSSPTKLVPRAGAFATRITKLFVILGVVY